MDRIEFLGCPIDNVDYNAVLTWMENQIALREPARLSVVNANKLWMMSRNPRLDKIIKNSQVIVAEWAVYWSAQKLGLPLRSCVYGIELAKAVIPWARKQGYSLYFLGAKPEVVQQLTEKLTAEHPGLQIAGYHHGYLDQDETRNVVLEMKAVKPDILFVAMGSPRQEYWIYDHLKEMNVPVSMGVGGTFDVLAGLKKDTPSWARGHGLEWFYRLSQDPKAYWRRYLITNSWILWHVLAMYITHRLT